MKKPIIKCKSQIAQTGFTLVETFVAIVVLTASIAGPMTIASQSLSGARYAKEQITAYYLAQEGIELVRTIRDNNFINNVSWNGGELAKCYSTRGCYIDPTNLSVTECDTNGCPVLKINSVGFYQYSVNDPPSQFTRKINISNVGTAGAEIFVSSSVTWRSSFLQASRDYTVTANLTGWAQ